MGILDRFKKKDDDLGDMSDLGDFGLDDKSLGDPSGGSDDMGLGGPDLTGDLPSPDVAPKPGMQAGVPTHMEDVAPSQASHDLGAQHGIDMTVPEQQPSQTSSGTQQQSAQFTQSAQQAAPQQQPQSPQTPQPSQAQTYPQPQYSGQSFDMNDMAKDMEIIHAKLDAIKSSLDSVNQRLATLERMAGGSQQQRRYSW